MISLSPDPQPNMASPAPPDAARNRNADGTRAPDPMRAPGRLPLVSFIIRNRNYGHFLSECIASIQDQTYPRFEVVVVDNDSTDDSVSIAQEAARHDARFTTIALRRNAGPLGAALPALEICSGEFVCFVDADDFLLPSFAACHIQAHLAVPQNLAVTSSNVFEINEAGNVLSSGRSVLARDWPAPWRGLRPHGSVLSLPGVTPEAYEALSRAFVSFPTRKRGWLWGPGTSNMYRRPIIDLLLPRTDEETLARLSADGHFMRLGHLLGGSGLIDLPLSAYRIHGSNFFASTVSIGQLRNGHGQASRNLDIRLQVAAATLLGAPERYAAVMSATQFWEAVSSLLRIPLADEPYRSQRWRRFQTVRPYLTSLSSAFGRAQTVKGMLRVLR